jgi:hypothetical protein
MWNVDMFVEVLVSFLGGGVGYWEIMEVEQMEILLLGSV